MTHEERDLENDRWFQTVSGRPFWVSAPLVEDIHLEDIAHSLALQCRFFGHVRWHYSVAQHSYLVSLLLERWGHPREVVLCGLLHDAAEAYVGDMVRPIKHQLDDYRAIEERVERVVADSFGLSWPWPEVVKKADNALLHIERRDLLVTSPRPSTAPETAPPDFAIGEMQWSFAKDMFLRRYEELTSWWGS